MILLWMTYASLIAIGAATAACALEIAARALGRSTRFVWLGAIAFSLLWPLWRVTSALVPGTSVASATSRILLPSISVAAPRSMLVAFAERLTTLGAEWSMTLLILWVATSALLLLRIGFGIHAIHAQRRSWVARVLDGVDVLVAPDAGPAVVGILNPRIVIPDWALTLEPNLRALVLRHELEHVRARDTAPRLLAALLPALLPWNPAVWWQANRLTLAIEVDCDARVLRDGVRRDRYGLLLLAIAQRQTLTTLAPALSEPTSQLEQRILVMQRSHPRRPMLVAFALVIAAAAVLAFACSAPAPDSPSGSTPRMASEPYLASQVERQVSPLAGGPVVRYPRVLRTLNVEGSVLAQFVVDATGLPDMSTLKVLKSDHELFTSAVRSGLAGMRFNPAQVGGRPVSQVVRMAFQFSLSLPTRDSLPGRK